MNNLEKADLIRKLCKKNHFTAYEISKNTGLSTLGIQNLLTGKSKKPNTRTVNTILTFLEEATLGTNLPIVNDPKAEYNLKPKKELNLEERIANEVVKKLKPILDEILKILK